MADGEVKVVISGSETVSPAAAKAGASLGDLTQQTKTYSKEQIDAHLATVAAMEKAIAAGNEQGLATKHIQSQLNELKASEIGQVAIVREQIAAQSLDTESKLVNTAATEANTVAQGEQMFMGRKVVNLIDELSRGQRGSVVSTLGSVLNKTGSPEVTMGILGLGVALLTVYEIYSKLNAQEEKFTKENASSSVDLWADQVKGITADAEAAEEYSIKLQRVFDINKAIADQAEHTRMVLDDLANQNQTVLDFQEKQALAALKRRGLTPDAERRGEDEIRETYSQKKQQQAFDDSQSKINAIYFEKMQQGRAVASLKKQSDDAEAAKEAADKEPVEDRSASIKNVMDSILVQQGRVAATLGVDWFMSQNSTGAKMAMGQRDMAFFQKDLEQNAKAVADHSQKVKEATSKLETVSSQLNKAHDNVDTLNQKIYDAETNLYFQKQTANKTGSLTREDVAKMAIVDSAYQSGQKLDSYQNLIIANLKSYLDNAHENSKAVLEVIAYGVSKYETIDQILAQVQSQIAASRSTP